MKTRPKGINQNVILAMIVCTALAGVIGFAAGVLLTRPSRAREKAKLDAVRAQLDKRLSQVTNLQMQMRALRANLRAKTADARDLEPDLRILKQRKEAEPKWAIHSHFGMTTTVYISKDGIKDKFLVAQILHVVQRKHGNGTVWFFDDKEYTPSGVPMTDEQLLHWIGTYSAAESATFSYIKVTNPNISPPELKMIKTDIRPGFVK